jgi:hypothetical protein
VDAYLDLGDAFAAEDAFATAQKAKAPDAEPGAPA